MTLASLKQLRPRDRVIYQKNPLIDVVAAIQFPPVLRLLQEAPKDFQSMVGRDYPLTSYMQANGQVAPVGQSIDVLQPAPAMRTTTFSSLDNKWMVSVAPTLFALTCSKYSEWTSFRERFASILRIFSDAYKIPVTVRVGVRFRDVINKEHVNAADHPWRDLIRPEVLSSLEFFTNDLDHNPPASVAVQLAIPPGRVNITLGTVTNPEKQFGFLIDTDCYNEEASPFDLDAVIGRVDGLHDYTSIVFQSCITDFLHERLEPIQQPTGIKT